MNCVPTQPLSFLSGGSVQAPVNHIRPPTLNKPSHSRKETKNVVKEHGSDKNYSNFHEIINGGNDDGHTDQLHEIVKRKVSVFDNNITMVTEIDLSSLDIPTLSPSVKEELKVKILNMSNMKKEYEIDEMMKEIEKNEHNLKRVNISISLSRENNANFEKKAAESKAQLDELVTQASEMGYADDSKYHLKIHKLLDDLDKIDERMKKYNNLLDKQKDLIIRKLSLQHNLTFFESVIHS